jgi:hypothetical protein
VLFDLIGGLFSRLLPRVQTVRRAPHVIIPGSPIAAQRLIDEGRSDWKAVYEPNPSYVHIFYREGVNPDGTLNDNRRDLWNDLRMLVRFWPDGRPQVVFSCICTTEPGTYYDRDHVIGGPLGAALIALGQQSCWQVGTHHPGYAPHESLVQTGGPVRIYRDFDRSFRRQSGHITTGNYGINQHSTGGPDAGLNSIGKWSAGCLVAPRMSDHRQFMAQVKADKRFLNNHQHIFDTTVLPAIK